MYGKHYHCSTTGLLSCVYRWTIHVKAYNWKYSEVLPEGTCICIHSQFGINCLPYRKKMVNLFSMQWWMYCSLLSSFQHWYQILRCIYALPPRMLVLYETTHLPVTAIAPLHLDQSPCSIARLWRENEQLTAMPRTVSLYVHLHTCDCTSSLHSGVYSTLLLTNWRRKQQVSQWWCFHSY